MTIRHGIYYGIRREQGWYRATVYAYENNRKLWQETKGLPMFTQVNAAAFAKREAEAIAAINSPAPLVHGMSDRVRAFAVAA